MGLYTMAIYLQKAILMRVAAVHIIRSPANVIVPSRFSRRWAKRWADCLAERWCHRQCPLVCFDARSAGAHQTYVVSDACPVPQNEVQPNPSRDGHRGPDSL